MSITPNGGIQGRHKKRGVTIATVAKAIVLSCDVIGSMIEVTVVVYVVDVIVDVDIRNYLFGVEFCAFKFESHVTLPFVTAILKPHFHLN